MNADAPATAAVTYRSLREGLNKVRAVKLLRAYQPNLGLRRAVQIVNGLSDSSIVLHASLTRFERAAFEAVGFSEQDRRPQPESAYL